MIFGGQCRFAQDDTVGRRGVGCGLTVGAGGMRYVGALACSALIRRCGVLYGTSQQRRSRLLAPRLGRGSLCGNGWRLRVIFGEWCRYDEVICSEMTRWGTGAWDGKQNAVLFRKVKSRIS